MKHFFATALLVEDEPQLASSLEIALAKLQIKTRCASSISEAKKILSKFLPDFILLDRMLPDGDGLDICSWLRARNFTGIILVLTASGHIHDRVIGLNSGADDYLAKPFSWEELEARIGALARRGKSPPSSGQTQLWLLDEPSLRIFGKKGWVELTPLEFKLAANLITHPGIIISRDQLLNKVWGFQLLPKTRTVDHFLGRLRKYFEQDPNLPQHFLTIRGAGYKFLP
jgi:two-component system, OmpR family, alkaline phosphatase synthesis response regulator PhoP